MIEDMTANDITKDMVDDNVLQTAPYSVYVGKHICQHCGLQTLQKTYMMLHKDAGHEEKLFQCSVCEYWTTQTKSLVAHQKSMQMAQKLQCSECGYQATQKSSLHTLKSMHIGQKFQCPECEHQATQKSHLVTHQISVHMGQIF